MTSLINTVRDKYLKALESLKVAGKWKLLVVDEHSRRLIHTVLDQSNILLENITEIEVITNPRDPKNHEAIYILMPTTKNVDRIIADFSGVEKKYPACYLFFTDPISDQLLLKINNSPGSAYVKSVKDLYLNFWPIESQAFSLKLPEQFFGLYSPPKNESALPSSRERLEEDITFMAKMIANVCISLDEYPYIRYYLPPHHKPLGALKPLEQTRPAQPPPEAANRWRTNLARGAQARAYEEADTGFCTKLLALQVQGILDEYKKYNSETFPGSDRPRGTLLITDRAMDTLTPFIHEFTYQAMSNDLLPIEDGTKYSYKFQTAIGACEDTTVTLSDADTVYTAVRHMHMREAIDKLVLDFNGFLREHTSFQGEGIASLNDMKDMLASLPQYKEQREQFSLHLNMAQECMGIFERDRLETLASIEQNCATGLTAEGKPPKQIVEQMVPSLDSQEVKNYDKVRIIALYIQYKDGVSDEDRRRLFRHAKLSLTEQDAVNALAYLGVRVTRGPNDDTRKKLKQRKSSEEEYELSRYKPMLRTTLEDHVNGRLDQQTFPYVKDSPMNLATSPSFRGSLASPTTPTSGSLRSSKPNWHKPAPKAGTAVEIRQRVLVFVAGGMTYSEMREAYLLSKSLNKDIIIGSTHTITPKSFVSDMKSLELAGVGSRALPNGLRQGPGQREFQAFYDEKYPTVDVAPPKPQPQKQPPEKEKGGKRNVLRPTMPPTISSSDSGASGKKKKRFFGS